MVSFNKEIQRDNKGFCKVMKKDKGFIEQNESDNDFDKELIEFLKKEKGESAVENMMQVKEMFLGEMMNEIKKNNISQYYLRQKLGIGGRQISQIMKEPETLSIDSMLKVIFTIREDKKKNNTPE